MRHHDDSVAERMNFLEFLHNNMAGTTVEIASRLVGENNARVGD